MFSFHSILRAKHWCTFTSHAHIFAVRGKSNSFCAAMHCLKALGHKIWSRGGQSNQSGMVGRFITLAAFHRQHWRGWDPIQGAPSNSRWRSSSPPSFLPSSQQPEKCIKTIKQNESISTATLHKIVSNNHLYLTHISSLHSPVNHLILQVQKG